MQFTYTTLALAIKQYTLEGVSLTNTDFDNFLPTVIQLGEYRLIRDLNSSVFDATYSTNLSVNDPFLAKPAGYLDIRSFRISTDGFNYIPLVRKDITWLENYWRNAANLSEPIYFANYDDVSFKLAPTPGLTYNVTIRYIKRPPSIAANQLTTPPTYPADADPTTTWLSTNAADSLLYACLVEAMGYLREDLTSEAGMTANFEAHYNRELGKLKFELSNQIITGLYY